MYENIKISIITPLYNSESYIDNFVSCFLNQTLDNIELIFVDDASPDNSYKKAVEYEKQYLDKIRVFHYDKNRGAGGARNFGLNKARGKYVCFVDPDDWMDNTMLYKLYTTGINEKCDIVDCDYFDYYCDKNMYLKMFSLSSKCVGNIDAQKLNLLSFSAGRIFTKIFDKDMLINNLLFYPENIRFEDNGVNLCLCAKKIGKVYEHLFYYRTSSNTSQTGNMLKKDYVLDRVKAAEFLTNEYIRLGKFKTAYFGLEYRVAYIGYASNIYIYIISDYNINFETLARARNHIKKYFKNYRHNKYYKYNMPFHYKLSVILYELHPNLIKIYKRIRPILRFRYRILNYLKGNV